LPRSLASIDCRTCGSGRRHGFVEIARRHGDYAIVGATALVELDDRGRCAGARLVYLSVGEGPTMAHTAASLLAGEAPSAALIDAAAHAAAHQDVEPLADIHATVAYRRHLVEVLGRRTLTEAFDRAQVFLA